MAYFEEQLDNDAFDDKILDKLDDDIELISVNNLILTYVNGNINIY